MHKSACLTVFWLLTMLAVVHGQPVDGLSKRAPDDAVPGIRKNVMILFIGSAAGGFVLNVILFVIVTCMANKAKASSSKSKTSSLNSQKVDNTSTHQQTNNNIGGRNRSVHSNGTNNAGNSNNSRAAQSSSARSVASTVESFYTGKTQFSRWSAYMPYYKPKYYIKGGDPGVPLELSESEYIVIQYYVRQVQEKYPNMLKNVPNKEYADRGENDKYWYDLRDQCNELLK